MPRTHWRWREESPQSERPGSPRRYPGQALLAIDERCSQSRHARLVEAARSAALAVSEVPANPKDGYAACAGDRNKIETPPGCLDGVVTLLETGALFRRADSHAKERTVNKRHRNEEECYRQNVLQAATLKFYRQLNRQQAKE